MANNNITRRSFIGAAGIAASTLAACGNAGGGSGDAATGKVYWLNFKPELDETLQTIKDMYKEAKGIEPKRDPPDHQGHVQGGQGHRAQDRDRCVGNL